MLGVLADASCTFEVFEIASNSGSHLKDFPFMEKRTPWPFWRCWVGQSGGGNSFTPKVSNSWWRSGRPFFLHETMSLTFQVESRFLCQDLSKTGRHHFSFDSEKVAPMDCLS